MTPEQFLGLADLLPEPSFLISSDGSILAANRAASVELKKPAADLLSNSISQLASTPKKKLRDFLRSCSATSGRVFGGLDFRLADDGILSCRCEGGRVSNGHNHEPPQIFLRCVPKQRSNDRFIQLNRHVEQLNREIKERERSEQALRQSEEMLRGIIDNATAVISIKDLEGKYILCNLHFESLFNVDTAASRDFTDFDIFPAEVAAAVRKNDKRVLEANTALHSEETFPGEDGIHTYLSIKFPLYDMKNQPYAVCTISSDITPIKRAEEKVREFNLELEGRVSERTEELMRAYKELESFSYSVSHDLRTPLRSIDGFSKALLDDYAGVLDDTGKDFLTRIRNATQRMGHLIDSLLQLSRIGRAELDYGDVDLSDMANDIFRHLGENHPEQKVVVKIHNDMQVRGDKKLLHIALENLLNNAWKFSGKEEEARIEVGRKDDDGKAVFFVRDNGIGFDMRYAEKLFGAFQRLHNDKEFEGTGIGLATVQRVIARHGGTIWAESEPGEGTTFFFTLGEPRPVLHKPMVQKRAAGAS